jgi:hypothetical protein
MEPRDSHLRLVRPPGIASDTGFQALLVPDLENEPRNGVEMEPGLYVPGIMEWERDRCCRPDGPERDGHEHGLRFALLPVDLMSEELTPIGTAPDGELPGLLPQERGRPGTRASTWRPRGGSSPTGCWPCCRAFSPSPG